jgi:hypothetical protein
MTDRKLSALFGLVLAPKGEASPILAFEGPGRPQAASPDTWGRGSGHGLSLLIRRQPDFAAAHIAPLSHPVAARASEPHGPAPSAAFPAPKRKRRQLTVRLPFDQFHRFHDLARRGGRTYQDILATATHAYLEHLAPRR